VIARYKVLSTLSFDSARVSVMMVLFGWLKRCSNNIPLNEISSSILFRRSISLSSCLGSSLSLLSINFIVILAYPQQMDLKLSVSLPNYYYMIKLK